MKNSSKPMRVLCVFSCLERGGAENMCMNLYRNINRDKIQFDFVKHTPKKGALEDEIMALGGKIYEAPTYKIYNHFCYRRWWKKHLKNHPEHKIVHGHYFTIAPIYLNVAKKLKRYTISHSHNTSFGKNGMKDTLKVILSKCISHRSDKNFACSNAAGKWLFGGEEFTVLKNAIDTKQFIYNPTIAKKIRKELFISDKDIVIGHVGSFRSPKNHMFLLKIFKKIHDNNKNYKLLLVGDGELRNEIEKKMKEYSLTDSVILTGVRHNVNELMMAMDIFVLPSFYEGLPVVAIEAQTSGLPCFVSDTITNEVILKDNCFEVPLNNLKSWTENIENCKIVRDGNLQNIMDSGYDIKTTSKWIQNFYLSI